MSCCGDAIQIQTCPPYANAADVQRVFDALDICCKGSFTAGAVDPVANPAGAMALVFPGGGTSCCDVLWITDTDGNRWGSWNNGSTFTKINLTNGSSSICCKGGTLAKATDPNPISDAAAAKAASFPSIVFGACDCPALVIPFDDNTEYVSFDNGSTFQFASQQPMSRLSAPSGQNIATTVTAKITMDTIRLDRYSDMADLPNSRIKVQVPGDYLFIGRLTVNAPGATQNGRMVMKINYYNASNVLVFETFGNGYNQALNGVQSSFVVSRVIPDMAKGEYIEMYFTNDTTGTRTMNQASMELRRLA